MFQKSNADQLIFWYIRRQIIFIKKCKSAIWYEVNILVENYFHKNGKYTWSDFDFFRTGKSRISENLEVMR